MFTLQSYLKKVQEETVRILNEADNIRTEKTKLVAPIYNKGKKGFFQNPEEVKQLNDFIKDREIPFIETVADGIKDLVKKKGRFIKLLEKAGKNNLIVDVEWLWRFFEEVKPEVINIHSRIKKERDAIKKNKFVIFVRFYDLEQAAYSKIDKLIKDYQRVGIDVYNKTKESKVLELLKKTGTTLKRVAIIVSIGLLIGFTTPTFFPQRAEARVTIQWGGKSDEQIISEFGIKRKESQRIIENIAHEFLNPEFADFGSYDFIKKGKISIKFVTRDELTRIIGHSIQKGAVAMFDRDSLTIFINPKHLTTLKQRSVIFHEFSHAYDHVKKALPNIDPKSIFSCSYHLGEARAHFKQVKYLEKYGKISQPDWKGSYDYLNMLLRNLLKMEEDASTLYDPFKYEYRSKELEKYLYRTSSSWKKVIKRIKKKFKHNQYRL